MSSESEKYLGLPPSPDPKREQKQEPGAMPRRERLFWFFGLWLAALIITAPDPRAIILVWAFPAGLGILFGSPGGGTDMLIIMLGWCVYFILGLITLSAETRQTFFRLWTSLLVLLLLNVAGCHSVLGGLAGIRG